MHCPNCDARMAHCIVIQDGEEPKMGWLCDDCGNFIADEKPDPVALEESR
jgi:hypothetical protein